MFDTCVRTASDLHPYTLVEVGLGHSFGLRGYCLSNKKQQWAINNC